MFEEYQTIAEIAEEIGGVAELYFVLDGKTEKTDRWQYKGSDYFCWTEPPTSVQTGRHFIVESGDGIFLVRGTWMDDKKLKGHALELNHRDVHFRWLTQKAERKGPPKSRKSVWTEIEPGRYCTECIWSINPCTEHGV